MTRRATSILLAGCVLLAAALAGCGGSNNRHASAGVVGATASTPSAPATTKTTSPTTGTKTASTRPQTTTTGASGVRLPATFTIHAPGGLTPPSVTAPTGVPIELTVISGDGKAHHVVLKAPRTRTLTVPAGAQASTVITGLAKGQYPLQVDGTTRGTLVIGGQPGP